MSSASIPPLSFFLGKVIPIDNLIAGISSYCEILQDELKAIDIYKTPMVYVEKSDYYEKISSFLEILQNERERTQKSANEGKSNAGADENAKTHREVHK